MRNVHRRIGGLESQRSARKWVSNVHRRIGGLEMSEPTPGHLRGVKLQDVLTGDIDALSTLIPRICLPFITPAQFAALSFKDVVTFQTGVIGFLADTPT